jgi:hypothetical protein
MRMTRSAVSSPRPVPSPTPFCGEKRFEDVREHIHRNSSAVVFDFHYHIVQILKLADSQAAAFRPCVDRVYKNARPGNGQEP